jgi:hypothetical protein
MLHTCRTRHAVIVVPSLCLIIMAMSRTTGAQAGSDATLYTNRIAFNIAATNIQTINFEGIAPPNGIVSFYGSGLTLDGVLFNASNPSRPGFYNISVVDPGFGFGIYDTGSGAVLTVQPGDSILEITFPSGVTAVGLDIITRGRDAPAPVTFMLSTGDVFTVPSLSFPNHQFVGFTSNVAISSIQITAGSGTGIDYDNFVFGQVITSAGQVANVQDIVDSFNLPDGIETSLQAKLKAALAAINSGDTATACTKLEDFIHGVQAQSGKKLMTAQADLLISLANQIERSLGCP